MLDLNREIAFLRQIPGVGQYLESGLRLLQNAVNDLGTNVGADPTQSVPAPPAIQNLNVKTDGNGNVHATIDHHAAIQKGIRYFVEYQQLPVGAPLVFSQPHVEPLSASRTMRPMPLPAKDDNGNPVHYIFRAYPQYPGGHPGEPVNFGGSTPTPVAPGGNGQATLLPSTGSGTAQTNGQQGGYGFGKDLFRPATGKKRNAA